MRLWTKPALNVFLICTGNQLLMFDIKQACDVCVSRTSAYTFHFKLLTNFFSVAFANTPWRCFQVNLKETIGGKHLVQYLTSDGVIVMVSLGLFVYAAANYLMILQFSRVKYFQVTWGTPSSIQIKTPFVFGYKWSYGYWCNWQRLYLVSTKHVVKGLDQSNVQIG